MHGLLPLLILAASATAPTDRHYPDATTAYSCGFEADVDADFDGWPDGWTRQRGPGFPHYLPIEMQFGADAGQGSGYLRLKLDGGAAAVFAQPVPLVAGGSYVFEALVRTHRLRNDRASVSLALRDAGGQTLETFWAVAQPGAETWTRLRIGPIDAAKPAARSAVIGLHLGPVDASTTEADLEGSACFDEIWLGQLPTLSLLAADPQPIYTFGQTITLLGQIQAGPARPRTSFELEDVDGQKLPPSSLAETTGAAASGTAGFWSRQWQVRVPQAGFYRARLHWKGDSGFDHVRELPLAVLEHWPRVTESEFGWTLPALNDPARRASLIRLVEEANIGWAKTPLWIDSGDARAIEQAVAVVEELRRLEVRVVGLLADPPAGVRKALHVDRAARAADCFGAEQPAWSASLEPLLIRFGLQVRAWQLGADYDVSLALDSDVLTKVERVRKELDRIGAGFVLMLPWRSDLPPARVASVPWESLSVTTDSSVPISELVRYLDAQRHSKFENWVVLRLPGAAPSVSISQRATALAHAMILAKIHGAHAIGTADVLGAQRGLIQQDGRPGELFLPWRTTAWALGGTEYLGRLQLPHDGECHAFVREGRAVLAVWSARPERELVELGSGAQQVDLWGRTSPLAEQGTKRVVELGPTPVFITGTRAEVARWRQAMSLETSRFASVFGVTHHDAVKVTNTFDEPVSGMLRVVPPPGWRARPSELELKLDAGEQARLPVDLLVPLSGTTGPQVMQLEVELTGRNRERFSVYQRIDVGEHRVRIEIASRIDSRGELEIQQRLINETDTPVSFRCNLYAPGERRSRYEVLNLGRGEDLHVYRLENGARFADQTLWVRAEEIGGPRVLSYRFVPGRN